MILAQNLQQQLSGNKFLILIIKNTLTYFFIAAFIVVFSLNSFGQTDSLEVHTIKGREYYIHIIEKGESLYAIHKKYNIPLTILKEENPSVADGLSIGEKLFIPVKRDSNQPVEVDGNFITHEVQKKQTLYSISKLYKVQQNEIIAVNPEIEGGLQEGQVIKIPVKNLKEINNDTLPVIKVPTIVRRKHVVKKGETLYSLSKEYKLTVQEIKDENNGLLQGLREGETIILPGEINIEADSLNIHLSVDSLMEVTDSLVEIKKKPVYNIGLLLPFYLDENAEIVENRKALEEKKIYPRSQFAIEFYNGFIMALDSLYSDSCKFKVFAYDTQGKDTARIKMLLQKPIFKELDLIVGPLYYDNFEIVAAFSKQYNVPLVSPVKQSNKVLLGNPNIFKVIPSKTAIIAPLAKLVVDSFKTENLIAVAFENAKEKPLVDLFVKEFNKQKLIGMDTTIYSSIKIVNIKSNIADIVSQFSSTKNNIVFVPTSNQVSLTSMFSYLITTLNKRDYKDYRVTLIGLEEWMEFENIDLDYFQRLNIHYCSSQFTNEKDSLTQMIIKKYIDRTETYPSENALLGFDLGYYFGNYLSTYGVNISPDYLYPYKGNSIEIDFFKTGIESGFENTKISLLRFHEYEIDKIE